MKKLAFSLLALLAMTSCTDKPATPVVTDNIQYLPFQESANSGWGLIGTDGQVLVSNEYQQMPTVAIHDRFFAKNKEGLWELYTTDKNPKLIGTPYSQAGAFIAEVAPVVEKGKFIEFIDVNGNVKFTLDRIDGKDVISCTNFSDGVAIFRAGSYYGAINTKGEVIADPRYITIMPANDGYMLALDKKYESDLLQGKLDDITYTVIATTGEEVSTIPTRRFKLASQTFVSGALVVTDESGDGSLRTGLVNLQGEWIVKASEKIKSIKAIREKTFIFNDGDAYGVMDFEGKELIRPRYADLVFADDKGLLYAKSDSEDAGYVLMDMQENKLGNEAFHAFQPFFGGKAIVQESTTNWILIDSTATDQRIKQDIFSISATAFGDAVLTNEHIDQAAAAEQGDYTAVIEGLKLTKDGFLGLTLGMNAESIAEAFKAFGVNDASKYDGQTTVSGNSQVGGVNVVVSSSFDSAIATGSTFSSASPNQIGVEIPAQGPISGKSGEVARNIIALVQSFGQTVKSNPNAAIVQVNDASYFVANNGNGIYVVYGYLDNSLIDIDQYASIADQE